MTEKARRDWRSWGMYPGRKYYVVAVGRPEQVDEGTRYYVHYITKTDGKNVMCVFSTPKKAQRFIRGGLEGDPQAYLDLLEDRGGSLPAGLREGDYTLIEETPDGLAEIGLEMGIHSMVLDPGPGENHPIPIGGGHPGLDPDGEYYVLLFRRALEADVCFHYVNHRGEEVLPIFSSRERLYEFVVEHARVNAGHLNILRREGVSDVITPQGPVAVAPGQVVGGQLTPVVETLDIIAAGLGTRYLVIDPGKPDSCYLELSP